MHDQIDLREDVLQCRVSQSQKWSLRRRTTLLHPGLPLTTGFDLDPVATPGWLGACIDGVYFTSLCRLPRKPMQAVARGDYAHVSKVAD